MSDIVERLQDRARRHREGGFPRDDLDMIAAAEIKRLASQVERKNEALVACRDFINGMINPKPASPGAHWISSYSPCQALVDKANAALTSDESK